MPDSEPPRIHLQDDDPWFFCYTGGTTGLPKAAIISHGNVIANAINTVISWGLDCRDVAILNAPLFHAGGLNVFTLPLVYAGGTSIVCKKFDANEVYELIANQGVTVFFGVPTMFAMLQEHPRWLEADFSGLKFVISGGMACPISIFEKFWDKGVEFKTGYGLTEAGPNTFWLPSEFVQDKPGSVGVPLMHIEVDIVDPDGQSVPDEQIGELRIRGPHVFQGYWHHPSETVAALRDGWLYTGDLARRDHDGFFYIAGRRKDMFISGGENIYPAEIENVLHAHPSVGEAAVIAIPHDKWGEIGLAIVRLLPNHEPTEAQILEHCRSHLARYKIPRKVIFTELIPKTGAGKIDKQLLLKTYQ
jgi:fatty-acyl-CoA synthase